MIPTLLLIGLVIGILPRWLPISGVLATAIAWTVLFARDDLLTGPIEAAFVFIWGLANLAAGAFLSWLVKRFIADVVEK